MANIPPTSERFKANLKQIARICDVVVTRGNADGLTNLNAQMIRFGIMYLDSYDSKQMIEDFICYSFPYWAQIKTHDEQFLLSHAESVFKQYKQDVIGFKQLFSTKYPDGSPLVSASEKAELWTLFESLVKIALHHVHEACDPYCTTVDGKTDIIYKKAAFTHVTPLNQLIKDWNLKNLKARKIQ